MALRRKKQSEAIPTNEINETAISDYHLEEDMISYLLENPHTFQDISKVIDKDTFTTSLFTDVFFEMSDLSTNNGTYNRFDVFRSLKTKKNNNPNLGDILKMLPNRAFSAMDVACELKEIEKKRHLNAVADRIKMSINDNTTSEEISSMVNNSFDELNVKSKSEEVYKVSDVIDEAIFKLEVSSENTKSFSGVDTGSRKLNYIIGGWQEGMHIIAGRPAMGKTIVGLEHAKCAAMSGSRVLFLSLEMPKEALIYRMISSEADEYAYSDLLAGRITRQQIAGIRQSNAMHLKQLPIFFYDSDNRDVNYLSAIITAEVRRNKIDLVIIDYLQLISDNQVKQQDDFSQVSKVSNKIQKLSRKLGLPIVCLSQLSRDIEKRTNRQPQLSDLRSSGNLEQDAITVIGLYRDDYYKYIDAKNNGQKPAPDDNTLKYIVLKNRNGQVGDITRYIDVRTNRLADDYDTIFGIKPNPQMDVFVSNKTLGTIQPEFDVTPF